MIKVEDYFNISNFEYNEIFDRVEFVWDTLKILKEYIDDKVKAGTYIKGRVMDGAYVSSDNVIVEEGAFVEYGAMVKGPAIIGRNAVIRHGAYIREYCIVGEECVVGHASELKGSIMLSGSQAPHFSYVGDTILGNHVNLGAGTKISNLKNDRSEITVDSNGVKYNTGLKKFGAIVGDYVQTGCNCVVNPGTLIGPGSMVYPNIFLRGVHPSNIIIKLRQTHEIEVIKS